MPLIIPLPLFVLSQNCWTAAWHWFGYMPPCSVWCGALLFSHGNVRQAPIYFYCFIPQHANGPCLVFIICFIPCPSIMYDSSHGATQSTRAVHFAFEHQAGIYHQTTVAQSLGRGRGSGTWVLERGKGRLGGGGLLDDGVIRGPCSFNWAYKQVAVVPNGIVRIPRHIFGTDGPVPLEYKWVAEVDYVHGWRARLGSIV